ncbi:signal peptide peptidase SppA [Halomonas sp. TBZ9]|uniref:Signal peptide peptidase SppA n=1 Tax=Vreelandella azerica TaxID=2732867 RepID=A0A7Y3TWZ2_9GAMM|nr:signal peptide peptidase SppA [Halomonas azerica]NOG30952.1 signal peptide peptidase SppA [Halomonas azerica]
MRNENTPDEDAKSEPDPWTQEVEPDRQKHQAEGVTAEAAASEDAETLVERQRLMQMEMMDRWIGGVLTEQRRSRRWKLFFRFVFVAIILASLWGIFSSVILAGAGRAMPAEPHLGIVAVDGVIASDSPANAERIIRGLNRAWEAEQTEAVVLHINSPGGSPVQSQRIYAEIMRLREAGDKPIIALIEDIGASGAYYIAAAADEIAASPASLVGSIGVIYSGFGFERAIDSLGIERRVLTAGENKAFLDPFKPLDEDTTEFWQQVLDNTHQQFIDDVVAGRGDRLSDNDEIFSGLIWSGEQAIELGLIDRLDSLESLSRSYFDEARWEDYTPAQDPFERLSRRFAQTAAQLLGLKDSPSPVSLQMPVNASY